MTSVGAVDKREISYRVGEFCAVIKKERDLTIMNRIEKNFGPLMFKYRHLEQLPEIRKILPLMFSMSSRDLDDVDTLGRIRKHRENGCIFIPLKGSGWIKLGRYEHKGERGRFREDLILKIRYQNSRGKLFTSPTFFRIVSEISEDGVLRNDFLKIPPEEIGGLGYSSRFCEEEIGELERFFYMFDPQKDVDWESLENCGKQTQKVLDILG